MYIYKLNKYSGAIEDEDVVFVHEDENVVAQKALELSKEDNDYARQYDIGIWSYRMERWKDGVHDGKWRFFNNGKEFTNTLRESLLRCWMN